MSDLWRPDDKRFRTDIEGAGEQVVTADEGPQIRLLRCTRCRTLEELPDFQGDPRDDHLLDHLVLEHQRRHPFHDETDAFLLRVSEEKWRNPKSRRAINAQIWADLKGTGLAPEYYAAKNTFIEDANKCHVQHNRQVPCIDWHNARKRIGNPTKEGWKEGRVKVYLCDFPFRGDTEIVTRDGIRAIEELVGKPVDLLIPVEDRWGGFASSRGHFATHEVIYAGQQSIWRVVLRRGRSEKVVHTTAEHRWFVREGKQDHVEVITRDLGIGDRLQPLKATPPRGRENPVPFGIAQGFVFGDGSIGRSDRRPATVTFYSDKDSALKPYFATCQFTDVFANGAWHQAAVGLPRHWKDLPPLRESRSFLLSWLAGYFAADGSVDKGGSAILYSAYRQHLEFVRSLAAICGVGMNPIREREREGFGRQSKLYSVILNARDLPEWFWLLDHHRERALARGKVPATERMWMVQSVEATDEVTDVYCAVVEGVGAFALADDIMTGNCPVASMVMQAKRQAAGQYD